MRHSHPRGAELLDPTTYLGDPRPLYATLRREAPVTWVEEPGFWAVSTHQLLTKASLHPEDFCSSRGILVEEIGTTYASPPTMMHTDAPEHTRYRRLAQPGFKPTVVRQLRDQVAATADRLLNTLPIGEDLDIVTSLAIPFPLQVIAEILGADIDEWSTFFRWSEAAIPGAQELDAETRAATQLEMWNYLIDLAEQRRREPRDDLVSAIATAPIDGDLLSEAELAMFLIQLLVAGNETTRNLISGGLVALADRPEQWQRIVENEDVLPTAVEELLRWTTPVTSFLRTATKQTSLGGVEIGEGDPILLLYGSANLDEDAFGPTVNELDVTRSPNPQVSFGVGNHFCLGAALARMEADILLRGLASRASTLQRIGEVERSPSTVIAGLRHATLRLDA